MDTSQFLADLVRDEVIAVLTVISGIVLHECGHAVVGAATGLHPYLMVIGRGPILTRFRVRKLWVVLKLWPMSGRVGRYPLRKGQAAAGVMTAFAGPAINAVLAALFHFVAVIWPAQDFFDIVALGQLILAIGTLLPYRFKSGGQVMLSDGSRILRYLRRNSQSDADIAYVAASRLVMPAGAPLPPLSENGPALLFHLFRPDRMSDEWAQRDAFIQTRALLEDGALNAVERRLGQELCAGIALLYPQCRVTEAELDAWTVHGEAPSATAYSRLTRAAALVPLGRAAESIPLLQSADIPDNPAARFGQIMARSFATAALGDADQAMSMVRDFALTAPRHLRALAMQLTSCLPRYAGTMDSEA